MNYVDEITAALAAELPGCDRDLLRFYTLLALVRGEECTLEDVHDAWAVHTAQGRPDHRSLIPFSQLSVEVQELDRKYTDTIRTVAAQMKAGTR